ncbi:hypothetical protein [Streptomyces lydicus]|uniref:hypothetical protein n=1 Tax=Streptomyces lydicus TaxID=47763 RepID=UPI001011D848|nr:hypothetical protein [Streptomyces lydicus]MCZ1011997.1 hypothetical protein [Streptomyces lydicus]
MGYELYYEGRITFDRPVRLDGPDAEEYLCDLAVFFNPLLFERTEGTCTKRYVTGFQVDEENSDWAKSWPWSKDFVAIEDFARHHQITLTAHLRWQGDGCPPDPADDRGHIVFDLHGTHHQVPDSKNDDRAVEAHRQRSCTCYGNAAPHPTPAPSPAAGPGPVHRTVGPLTPMPRYTFSSLPTSLRFSLTAATAEEAQAQAARLEHETHDLASLSKLGVRIEDISFADHSDTEMAEPDEHDSADSSNA